jgi:HSP20 family protein
MTKQISNNSISLMQCFDDIFDTVEKACSSITTNNSTTIANCSISSGDNLILGSYNYYPYDTDSWRVPLTRRWNDFSYIWTIPTIKYEIETPTYPVSNYSIMKDGTSVIEIAVSGFYSDEITVKREGLKIIVEGKKVSKDEVERKYIYKHIGERDFTLEYTGSEKWDYDKLSVKLNNGILKIEIPIKEECKPVNRVYEIGK